MAQVAAIYDLERHRRTSSDLIDLSDPSSPTEGLKSRSKPTRPKPKRLRARREHRNAVLADLPEEHRPIAEQVLRGGMPAVRKAIEEQNAKNKADNLPEIDATALEKLAEDMLPKLKDPVIAIPFSSMKRFVSSSEETVSATCVMPVYFCSTSIRMFDSPPAVAGPRRFSTTPPGCFMTMGWPCSKPWSLTSSNPSEP